MTDENAPEPDRIDGAPHPRETLALYGQGAAEAAFLQAFNSGRLHHGWLLSGPRGVGKATLAWRIARFLLATPPAGQEGGLFGDAPLAPDRLDIPPEHPVARRVAQLSEPGLHLLRRGGAGTSENDRYKNYLEGKFSQVIRVDEVRELARFVGLSAADGGRRVVIVDSADEMNPQAANALLKMLEEPPARTTMLLISHQPARLLPTIRSRCRDLRLVPLGAEDMAAALAQAGVEPGENAQGIAELSRGSVGEAVRLAQLDGLALYGALMEIAGSLPRLDRARAQSLSQAAATRGAEARLDLLFGLTELMLARLARTGATGQPPPEALPGEADILTRLAPDARKARAWAMAAEEIGSRARHGRAVNLDPAALVLDTVLKLQVTARA
ncbi:MAG: DNA polymerase III subunit delta' [Roseovarius sp.]